MLKINAEKVFSIIEKEFPTLKVTLEQVGINYKICLSGVGGNMYFYPENAITFELMSGKKVFETEESYIDYLISDIKEFYGETL